MLCGLLLDLMCRVLIVFDLQALGGTTNGSREYHFYLNSDLVFEGGLCEDLRMTACDSCRGYELGRSRRCILMYD